MWKAESLSVTLELQKAPGNDNQPPEKPSYAAKESTLLCSQFLVKIVPDQFYENTSLSPVRHLSLTEAHVLLTTICPR